MSENFSDPANHHFRTASGPAFTVRAAGGTYRMLLKRSGLPHGELHDVGTDVETVSISLDMLPSAAASGSFRGPLCFYQQGFGFSLRLRENGSYELIQVSMDGKAMATLASGKLARSGPKAVHRFRLDCTWGPDQSTLVGWIDGTQVGPAQDKSGPTNNILRYWSGIGFWAMTTKAPTTFKVDNVVISEQPAQVPVPAPSQSPTPVATPGSPPVGVAYRPTGIASIDSIYGAQANSGQISAAQARLPSFWVVVLDMAGEENWRTVCSHWGSQVSEDAFLNVMIGGFADNGTLATLGLADQQPWTKEAIRTVTTLYCVDHGYSYPA